MTNEDLTCFHGQLGEEEGAKEVFESALKDSMWRNRLEGFLSPRPDKDRSSMSLEA